MTLANLEAEAALLGALMMPDCSHEIDAVIDRLSPADFSEPVHGRIFETITRTHSLGRSPTPIALRGYFESDPDMADLGGVGYLARLTANDGGVLVLFDLCDLIADLAMRRRMRNSLAAAADACSDMEADISEIVAHADGALDMDKSSLIELSAGQCMDALIEGLGRDIPGVTSGLDALDGTIGPARPKQFIILAARPGMGKTATAISYALGAASQGHGVLFVSLEMGSGELAERMAADMCYDGNEGVPYSAIRDGRLNDWQRRRVMEAGRAMHSLPLTVVDTGNLKLGRLNALIRRHKRRMEARGHKLELVIVDYIQLLRTDTNMRSNYEAVSEISRSLKAMAKDNEVALIGLAQLSREVEKRPDKRPQLADLRDSGQIEQDADTVLFLLREEYYHRLDEPDETDPEWDEWNRTLNRMAGLIEFICAKRRNGTTGSATGRFFGAYQAVRG